MSSVWVPFAKDVALVRGDEHVPMKPGADGWWRADSELVRPGQDYGFRVNGEVLPDPRSQWQPYGVHGRSRRVDHAAFHWTDARWQPPPLSSALIYELHIGTFTPPGTFDSAIERLDHLTQLGVTHVELMPVAEFLGDYGWGYDGVYPFAPHHTYGGPDGLKRLVDACHARGLAVLLDVVYNHLGPSGNYLGRYGPYFSDRHTTPWGQAINFDGPHSHEVRRYFADNAAMWLRDYHIDGLRLDAIHAIIDTSAYPFLEQLNDEIEDLEGQLGRHFALIAESDLNDPRVVRPPEIGGYGFDAQWSDDLHHALHTVITGERSGYYADFGRLSDLATALEQPFVYAGRHSPFRARSHGRTPTEISGHKFLAYLQNHDQIGNRARGERLSQLTNPNRLKIGAALVLLSPYVPMLFQGEEWAASTPFLFIVDFAAEPDLAKAVVQGRMREFAAFGWNAADIPDASSRESLLRCQLNWEELTSAVHADMLAWYRSLIQLRRSSPALSSGCLEDTSVTFDEAEQWLRVDRGPMTIACNFANNPRCFCFDHEPAPRLLISSQPLGDPRGSQYTLPPESVAVFQRPV